jgi:hypothetical protein
VTSARTTARASEIPDAVARPTTGSPAVRNETSPPFVVPAELWATRRAWYSVPGASPVTFSETATAPRPKPAERESVRVPYAVVGPISNHQFVARPTGSTLPVRVTAVPARRAGPVTTSGPALVRKLRVWPTLVPASLRAAIR